MSISKYFLLSVVLSFLSIVSLNAQSENDSSPATDSIVEIKSESPSASTAIKIVIPSLMVTYGLISLDDPMLRQFDHYVKNEIHKNNWMIHNNLDDYLQFSPAVVAFGMKGLGIESAHKPSDMLILYAISNIAESAVVLSIKKISARMRPDESLKNSFPSGHTATAFVAAEFLYQEYKDQSVWISIGGYTMASLIGVSRMLKDRHWASDVIAGAGIGILSTKVAYWLYPYLKELFDKKDTKGLQSFICPSYSNGALCLNISCHF